MTKAWFWKYSRANSRTRPLQRRVAVPQPTPAEVLQSVPAHVLEAMKVVEDYVESLDGKGVPKR